MPRLWMWARPFSSSCLQMTVVSANLHARHSVFVGFHYARQGVGDSGTCFLCLYHSAACKLGDGLWTTLVRGAGRSGPIDMPATWPSKARTFGWGCRSCR